MFYVPLVLNIYRREDVFCSFCQGAEANERPRVRSKTKIGRPAPGLEECGKEVSESDGEGPAELLLQDLSFFAHLPKANPPFDLVVFLSWPVFSQKFQNKPPFDAPLGEVQAV